MDTYSSGEDVLIKARKPYTITKQRERWTEEEHNRFLEALKRHGRAWQRIEEHIGTKTAVQIRSHAQKFFSKLEKEALVKGVPIGQALDIDIPPPRPKRKPSNPYPRKTGAIAPTFQVGTKDGKESCSVSTLRPGKQILDLEKEPISESGGDEKLANSNENQVDEGADIFTLFQEARCTSVSSGDKSSVLTSVTSFREFVPPMQEVGNQDETNESYITVEPKSNQRLDQFDATQTNQDNGAYQASNLPKFHHSSEKTVRGEQIEKPGRPLKLSALPTDVSQPTQNYPRHVPVHILDGSLGTCAQTSSGDISYQESASHHTGGLQGHPGLFTSLAASAPIEHQASLPRSSINQSFPTFHPPFAPICNNQEDYRSFLQLSSAFSSLVVSTLLQNPAAHAAASFSASFWPGSNVEASAESPAGTLGGIPSRQMSPAPSMAAIAAATVAAATAWWAAHGLLPFCAPLHTGFPCAPASTTAVSSMDTGQVPVANTEERKNTLQDPPLQDHQLEPESSEALQAQLSASKSPTSSSSDSESAGAKVDIKSEGAEQEKAAAVTELNDSNKAKSRKQVDRSSCGSNTPSSSEVETDALEKHEEGNEELKEPDTNHPISEAMNRRSRSTGIVNDAWKEVSEEGKLAFQALFSREILPQSFSPPPDLKNKGQQNNIDEDKQQPDENDGDASMVDLNSKAWGSCFSHQGEERVALLAVGNGEEGLLTIGLGHGKLKARRTGFKPYKRCSVEAKESRMGNSCCQSEEKGPKRIRLEGEAST